MKTARKIGLSSVGMLSAVRNAEASLARREAVDLENGLPEGHPLRNDLDKQKALIGDLSDLPPGHPLLLQMQAAKERYDQLAKQRTEEQGKTREVRNAKKIDADKARREARRMEEEYAANMMVASKQINSGIDNALNGVRSLYKVMSEHEELLNKDPLCRSRVVRLKRILFASEKGLSECRLAQLRA